MRFYNYINEENINKVREDINKLCKPYIKNLKKMASRSDNDKFLFSGRKSSASDVIKGKVRQDRRPKDMPLEVHELLDKQFQKEFGIKARSNSLFCTLRVSTAKAYGVPYYIFPIGNYTTIWSNEVNDLFEWIKDDIGTSRRNDFDHLHGAIDNWKHVNNKEEILDIIEDMNIPAKYYTDKSYIRMKRDSDNEIMLHCKEYIGIGHAFVHNKFISIWELIDG